MDERSRKMEARLEPVVITAALLVIPLIVIEEGAYGDPWDTIAVALNWGTWLVFVAEAVIMLRVVPDRWRWIREHPIDVAVVVLTPPFLAVLAPVRLLRLLQLLRLLRLARVAGNVFSTRGLNYIAALAALTAVAGGAAFASVEQGYSTAEGVYWALTTMTTVGYGDLSPITPEGKAIAVVVMLVGIGFIAILTGAIAERFIAEEIEEEAEQLDEASMAILEELRAMRGQLGKLEASMQRRARSR